MVAHRHPATDPAAGHTGAIDEIDPNQYDRCAAEFAVHARSGSYNAGYERPATMALIGEVDGLVVFDVACGPGWHAGRLLDAGAAVIGCDASPGMIDVARRETGNRANLRVHRADDPFEWLDDESVDLVVMALAYHYVNDRPGFLREMHRVLRPDGAFVISTHHPLDDWRRLGGSYFETSVVTEHWRTLGWDMTTWRMPLTRMTEEFADAGFLIERLVEPRPLPELAESDPKAFDWLETAPAFILFRLVKRAREHSGQSRTEDAHAVDSVESAASSAGF